MLFPQHICQPASLTIRIHDETLRPHYHPALTSAATPGRGRSGSQWRIPLRGSRSPPEAEASAGTGGFAGRGAEEMVMAAWAGRALRASAVARGGWGAKPQSKTAERLVFV